MFGGSLYAFINCTGAGGGGPLSYEALSVIKYIDSDEINSPTYQTIFDSREVFDASSFGYGFYLEINNNSKVVSAYLQISIASVISDDEVVLDEIEIPKDTQGVILPFTFINGLIFKLKGESVEYGIAGIILKEKEKVAEPVE